MKIAPVGGRAGSTPALAPSSIAPLALPPEKAQGAKQAGTVHRVATEFESILLKQLLSNAHVLGKEKGGYADMALDALSTGLASAGGIGLAKSIEDSVLAAQQVPKKR